MPKGRKLSQIWWPKKGGERKAYFGYWHLPNSSINLNPNRSDHNIRKIRTNICRKVMKTLNYNEADLNALQKILHIHRIRVSAGPLDVFFYFCSKKKRRLGTRLAAGACTSSNEWKLPLLAHHPTLFLVSSSFKWGLSSPSSWNLRWIHVENAFICKLELAG